MQMTPVNLEQIRNCFCSSPQRGLDSPLCRTVSKTMAHALEQSNEWLADTLRGKPNHLTLDGRFALFAEMPGLELLSYSNFIRTYLCIPTALHDQLEINIACEHDGETVTVMRIGNKPMKEIYSGTNLVIETRIPAKLRFSGVAPRLPRQSTLHLSRELQPEKDQTINILAIPRDTKVIVSTLDDVTKLVFWGTPDHQAGSRLGEVELKPGKDCVFDAAVYEEWLCRCGQANCFRQHRFETWDEAQTIENHLFNAVKGPLTPIASNSFVQGMYFSLLSADSIL